MKHWKRIVALCLAACMCMCLFACTGSANDPTGQTPGDDTQPQAVTHTVQLATEGGMPFAGVGVYVYEKEGETLGELVWFARTDDQGKMTFNAPEQDGYVAVLENVPTGYGVDAVYPVTGLETVILLSAAMASDVDLETLKLGLGDAMFDLEVTDVNGSTWKISELLKQKKAVVLNFWYLACNPCRSEFPYLQEAYEAYEQDVAVLALNPVDTDAAEIKKFAEELGLSMPVAACDKALEKVMGLMAYPTTVVIDRYGVITLVHPGAIPNVEGFKDIFAHFAAEDYKQAVVENLEDILVTEPSGEEINNPTEVGGVKSFQLTVKPGEVVYCDLYRLDGMYLQIKSNVAYLIYNGKTYEPKNGAIGVTVHMKDTRTPAPIGVGNTGTQTETFTITFAAPAGSLNSPYTMTLGEFDVSIYAGNDQGVYYRYTAETDGYLIMQCLSSTEGVPYDYTLYNLSTYANRNLESDAEWDEEGNVIVKVQVKKGQSVQFSASALPDSNGTYPAINFRFKAELKEGLEDDEDKKDLIAYAVTVTNEKMQAVEKVPVIITGVNAEGKTITENLFTDTRGIAAVMLKKGTYTATVGVPAGYTAKTVKLTLTEQYPTQAVKLDTVEDTTTVYTVTVTDEAGSPLANVLVTVADSFVYTDETGTAEFSLPAGDYTAIVGIPEGYTGEMSHDFAGQTSLAVTLNKGTGGGEPGVETMEYAVTVVDYYGNPISGVTVTFLKEGVPAGIASVDASGVAKIDLEKGFYAVSLSFSSGSYTYAQEEVSEFMPSVTVSALRNRGNTYSSLYVGTAYHVDLGATYVTGLQPEAPNYFIFAPKTSGVYRFTTSDPQAKISYWGASEAYIADQTGITDFANNAFTREVREEQTEHTIFIFAVEGASECILEVTRVGDVQLSDEEKAEWVIFQGTQTPAEGDVYIPTESGTLTYVDLAGKTSDYTLVLGSDGYYHLGAADGPLMYVNLGPKGRYITFYEMMGFAQLGGTNMHQVFYDANGKFIEKVDYTECLKAYTGCVDANGAGIYPLTADLVTILTNGGENKGWWDSANPNFLFSGVSNLNTEIAWMFNCCYYQ